MPTYSYKCSKCKKKHDEFMLFADFDKNKDNVKCPKCGSASKQTFDVAPIAFVKEVKSLGQLADKNNKKLGKTKLEEIEGIKQEKKPKRKKAPWYGGMNKELAAKLNTGTKQEQIAKAGKYIREGKI